MENIVALHDAALTRFGRLLATTLRQELAGPSPCPEWTVRQLVEHTIGLNHGFAAALTTSDTPAPAYEPRPISAWTRSAAAIRESVRRSALDRQVRVAVIDADTTFAARQVVAMHLLDLVVHGWDLAAATGRAFEPAAEVVDTLAPQAELIAGLGPEGTRGMFGPVVAGEEAGWPGLLRRLGRDPDWRAPGSVTVRAG
jgi:uncharacterized protein (TIGR03086 family)